MHARYDLETGVVTNYDTLGNVISSSPTNGPILRGFNDGKGSRPIKKPANYAGAVGAARNAAPDNDPLPLPTMNFGQEQPKQQDQSDYLELPTMNFGDEQAKQPHHGSDDDFGLPKWEW